MGQILKDIKCKQSAGAVSDFGADEMYLTFAPAGLSGFAKNKCNKRKVPKKIWKFLMAFAIERPTPP